MTFADVWTSPNVWFFFLNLDIRAIFKFLLGNKIV